MHKLPMFQDCPRMDVPVAEDIESRLINIPSSVFLGKHYDHCRDPSTQYLPWIGYFDKADACDVFVYLDDVQYQKNGFQNRNKIKTGKGSLWLTVPVNVSFGQLIRDVRIANSLWSKKHVESIRQNYSNAKYFEWFEGELAEILERPVDSLCQLNIAVTEWMFEKLGIRSRVCSSELNVEGRLMIMWSGSVKLWEHRNTCQKRRERLSGPQKFADENIDLLYQEYQSQPYSQSSSQIGYLPDLSALDLILNAGPQARDIMLSGRRTQLKAQADL